MKVMLLQDIKGVGRKHDIKDLKEGYARNFLLPRKLAVVADERALQLKKETEHREKILTDKYQDWAVKLARQQLEFKVKAGDKQEVFGSVKKDDISQALKDLGFEVSEVVLPQPLKKLGDHMVEVVFGRGIRGQVKVTLRAL